MSKTSLADATLAELKAQYKSLRKFVDKAPWILQGSVNERPPAPDSKSAKTTYTWTRKVHAKTVTVALSPQQARAFKRAIAANRQLEKTLKVMREISQTALTETLPGVKKTRDQKTAKNDS